MMSTAEVNEDYGVELTNQDAPEAGAVVNDTGVELRPSEAAPSAGAVVNDTGVEVRPDVAGAVAKKPEKVNRHKYVDV